MQKLHSSSSKGLPKLSFQGLRGQLNLRMHKNFSKGVQDSEKVIPIKLQFLLREFDNLLMQGSETMKEFISLISSIVNQIRGYGDTIEDRKVVQKTVKGLHEKFYHIVAAIEESKDLSTFSFHELIGLLEYMRKD